MTIILPELLSIRIEESIAKISSTRNRTNLTQRAKWLCNYLYDKSIKVSGITGERIGIKAETLKHELGRHYKKILFQLQNDGILNISKGYSKTQTKTYWIDPSYIDGELIVISLDRMESSSLEDITLSILEQYTIDIEAAIEIIDQLANDDEALLSKSQIGDDIRQEYFGKIRVYSIQNNNGYEWKSLTNMSKTSLLNKFYEPSFTLIKCNKKLYYVPLEVFLQERRRKVRFSYLQSIMKIQNRDWYISRDKNSRLYTNLVNLPSILLPTLRHESNMPISELDIACCQWVIFIYCCMNPHLENKLSNHILEHNISIDTDDFKHFCKLVKSGELYKFIANNLGESSRDIGKSLTFEILFGKVYKEDSEGIALIRSYFPTVLSIIHSFKKTYSYRTLPNLLQSVESDIIVDTVLLELYEEGYTMILTKHDSFIYPNFIEIDNTDIKDVIHNRLFVILGDIFSYRVKTYPHNVAHFEK